MRATELFKDLFASERAGGMVLVLCSAISLLLTNTVGDAYAHVWHVELAARPLEFWINDGLMAVFFFVVGLEIRREIHQGELADLRRAALPIAGALGGMLVPALMYLAVNRDTPARKRKQDAVGIVAKRGKLLRQQFTGFFTVLKHHSIPRQAWESMRQAPSRLTIIRL